ncbi:hypothetical protein BH23ACT2_BH23ACT2_28400 [soil metagenome]
MPLYTTDPGSGGILPAEYGAAVITAVQAESLALSDGVTTTVSTSANVFRIPRVVDDAGANWTPEGEEIAASDAVLDEVVVVPRKLAGLTVISNELAADSSPAAADLVAAGIARSIASKVDEAFFGPTSPPPAPDGLASVTGAGVVALGALTNLDPFAAAIATSEQAGGSITAFVVSPGTALTLSTLKTADGASSPLLGVDAVNGTARMALGVPIRVARHLPDDVAWGLDASAIYSVLRADVVVDVDRSAFFTSDRLAVRAICRVGIGFVNEARLVRVDLTPPAPTP